MLKDEKRRETDEISALHSLARSFVSFSVTSEHLAELSISGLVFNISPIAFGFLWRL